MDRLAEERMMEETFQSFLTTLELEEQVDEDIAQVMMDLYSCEYMPPYVQVLGEEVIEVAPRQGTNEVVEMSTVEPVVPMDVLMQRGLGSYETMSIVAKAKMIWVEGVVLTDLEIPLFGAEVCQKKDLATATIAMDDVKARVGRKMVHHITGFVENMTKYDVLICVGRTEYGYQGVRFDFQERTVVLDPCLEPVWMRWSANGDIINFTEDVDIPDTIAPTYISSPMGECLVLMDLMFYWIPENHLVILDVVAGRALSRDGEVIFNDVMNEDGSYETYVNVWHPTRIALNTERATHSNHIKMLQNAAVTSDIFPVLYRLIAEPLFELVDEDAVFANVYGVSYQVLDDMRRKKKKVSRHSFMREALQEARGRVTWAWLNRVCQRKKSLSRVNCVGYRLFSMISGRLYPRGITIVKIRYKRRHRLNLTLITRLKVSFELLVSLVSGYLFCRMEAI